MQFRAYLLEVGECEDRKEYGNYHVNGLLQRHPLLHTNNHLSLGLGVKPKDLGLKFQTQISGERRTTLHSKFVL